MNVAELMECLEKVKRKETIVYAKKFGKATAYEVVDVISIDNLKEESVAVVLRTDNAEDVHTC